MLESIGNEEKYKGSNIMEKRRSSKLITPLRSCFFFVLATMAFSAYASDCMYLGNPNRPGTVWQPPHCEKNGCWKQGEYIKFITPATCHDVVWIDGSYDHYGNWIPAHFRVLRYTVVNPGSESHYAGVPI